MDTQDCSNQYSIEYTPSSSCDLTKQLVIELELIRELVAKVMLFCPNECPQLGVDTKLTTAIEKLLRLRSMLCNVPITNRVVITNGPKEAICEIDELANGTKFYYCRITGTSAQFGARTIEEAKQLLSL